VMNFWRRAAERPADRGASFFEYAALLAVVSGIIAALVLADVPEQILSRTGSVICKALGGSDCGGPVNSGQPNAGQNPKASDGDDGDCEGNVFQKGLCHTGNFLGGVGKAFWNDIIYPTGMSFKGFGLGLWDIGTGVWEGVTFTGCLLHICSHDGFKSNWSAIGALFTTDPRETIPVLWDEMTKHCRKWSNEDVARCATGFIGSLVGTKGLNKLGKLGKLGKIPEGALSKIDELADGAKDAANRAERLAREGKVDEAQRSADEAARKADEAEAEARRNGCRVGSLAPPGEPGGVLFGRMGAGVPTRAHQGLAVPVSLEGDECPPKSAKEARRQAGRAAKAVLKTRLKTLGLSDADIDALLGKIKDTDKGSLDALRKTLDATSDAAKARHITEALGDLAGLAGRNGLTNQSIQGVIARLKNASGQPLNAENRALPSLAAEVSHARRVADSGQVKPGTRIAIGAKGGTDFGGGHKVEFPAGVDADVAYVDASGRVHLNEVKETMNALISTLKKENGGQLDKYKNWEASSNGKAKFVVMSADGADDLFKPAFRTQLQQLIDSGIPVEIAGKEYDSAALRAAQARGHF